MANVGNRCNAAVEAPVVLWTGLGATQASRRAPKLMDMTRAAKLRPAMKGRFPAWKVAVNFELLPREPRTLFAPYSKAKAGLHALTQHLAMELAPNSIRVNAVSPAVVQTPIYEGLIPWSDVPGVSQGFNTFLRSAVAVPRRTSRR